MTQLLQLVLPQEPPCCCACAWTQAVHSSWSSTGRCVARHLVPPTQAAVQTASVHPCQKLVITVRAQPLSAFAADPAELEVFSWLHNFSVTAARPGLAVYAVNRILCVW